jgi:hypothetical protein
MRLTLRTLLAYMDEILEPADHEELTKKIESSEFAHDLILRTKDTMRRLRLSAPQPVGSGIGLDPNTVAEYLDNVLPPDHVADLERICLESDVHLAEVASCHHVLTMVLGEPAEVDPASRERLYAIPQEARERKQFRVQGPHSTGAAEQATSAAAPLPPEFAPQPLPAPIRGVKPREVPDYLRASAWTRYRVLLVALAAVLVLGITFLLTSGLKGWRSKSSATGSSEMAATSSERQSTTDDGISTQPNGASNNNDRSTAVSSSGTGRAQAVDTVAESASPYSLANNAAPTQNGAPPPLMIPSMSSLPQTQTQTPLPANRNANSAAAPSAPPAAVPRTGAEGSAMTGPPALSPMPPADGNAESPARAASVAPQEPATGPVVGGADALIASNMPVPPVPSTSSNTAPPNTFSSNTATPATAAPPAAKELGTYLDGQEVLLRRDPQADAWMRLLPRSSIHATDRLVSLPAFHPRITLATGVQLKLSGGTEISLASTNPTGADRVASKDMIPAIEVVYGRVVFVNTADLDNRLELNIGGTTATVHLAQNATLAVEVVRRYVPGRDPRQSASPVQARFFAPDGNVVWADAAGEQTIHAPSQWELVEGGISAAVAAPNVPEWIDGEPAEIRTDQLYGAPAIEQSLDARRPADTQLLELFQSTRKREVKSLVARSSIHVGLFVPFVQALRDSDQRATWKTQIDTLRSAMALGPEAANQIWATLKDQRGEPAAHDLYEMLCGYNADQIGRSSAEVATGAIPRLIDWLEKEDLDYRVLAVEDLGEITGKHLMPNPAGTATERAQGVRKWRERLKSGEFSPSGAGQ